MPDPAALPHWTADARSRAWTRALLMALARDRRLHFRRSTLRMSLLGLISCGVIPLHVVSGLAWRFRRMQWTELAELGSWIGAFRDRIVGDVLSADADARGSAGARQLPPILIVTAVGLLLLVSIIAWQLGQPALARREASAAIAAAAMGLLSVAMGVWSMHNAKVAWLRPLNDFLIQDGRRPILAEARGLVRLAAMGAALGVAVVAFIHLPIGLALLTCFTWFVAHQWDRFVTASREINLQVIERMLEWMDDSGLPVEYDVVALNPDEIAAMIA